MPTLSSLKQGQRGTIVNVSGSGAVSQRLMEMGLTEGEEIELVGFAPLGDPLEIQIRGYQLSLRKKEADFVEVTIAS